MIGVGLPVVSSMWPCAHGGRQDLVENLGGPLQRHGLITTVLDDLGKATAADVLHLDVADGLGAPKVVDSHGVGWLILAINRAWRGTAASPSHCGRVRA